MAERARARFRYESKNRIRDTWRANPSLFIDTSISGLHGLPRFFFRSFRTRERLTQSTDYLPLARIKSLLISRLRTFTIHQLVARIRCQLRNRTANFDRSASYRFRGSRASSIRFLFFAKRPTKRSRFDNRPSLIVR